jgi:acyl-coenzyme A thioesterase PaaI-like protein
MTSQTRDRNLYPSPQTAKTSARQELGNVAVLQPNGTAERSQTDATPDALALMDPRRSFQAQMPENHCWGCGSDNLDGLGLRSYWLGDEAVALWRPRPQHAAGPRHVLNGGIIAALIDCHSVCTAYAATFQAEDRPIGSDASIWFATANLELRYLRPTPIAATLTLRARVVEMLGRRTSVDCSLYAESQECARGQVLAVRVPATWREVA